MMVRKKSHLPAILSIWVLHHLSRCDSVFHAAGANLPKHGGAIDLCQNERVAPKARG
jgi:hypothetical protein